eukprot:jgi/Ulvmu1/917/UM101_0026.1
MKRSSGAEGGGGRSPSVAWQGQHRLGAVAVQQVQQARQRPGSGIGAPGLEERVAPS